MKMAKKLLFNHAHFQLAGMQYRFYDAYMWYSNKDDSKFVNFAYKRIREILN